MLHGWSRATERNGRNEIASEIDPEGRSPAPFMLAAATLLTAALAPAAEPCTGRRTAVRGLAALILSGPQCALAASVTGTETLGRRCKTESNPARTVTTCLAFGQRADGRLAGCAADEACVATAAVNNPSKFSPPWAPPEVTAEARDVRRAWRSLIVAVEDEESLRIVERDEQKLYLRATAVSAVPSDGVDDVEFRLLDENGRVKAAFRSATRQSVFVYPLQQPLPNQKSHVDRLNALRLRLGWEELGLPGDGALEQSMGRQQVQNFFGLQLRGVSVPEEYDD